VCDRTDKASEFGVNVDGTLLGLETALARGPLKLQGEYVVNDLDATNPITTTETVRGDVKTFYIQAVWNITGEKWASAYKGGKFGGLKPNNNFASGGGWGAWQLGLRYSEVDASDLRITGTNSQFQSGEGKSTSPSATSSQAGRQNQKIDSYSIGLNWLLNPNARVMFEYTRTDFGGNTFPQDATTTGVTGSSKEDIFSVRTQLNF
jgi:phosphate-selective porin OprO/OprP